MGRAVYVPEVICLNDLTGLFAIWSPVADPRGSCGTNAKVTQIRITIQTLVGISFCGMSMGSLDR